MLAPFREPWSRTVLRFGTGELEVDLRVPVPASARAAFAALGLGEGFAVITPCNPGGRVLAPAANAQRLGTASTELTARGLLGVPVIGLAPDGSHWEPGWALPMPHEAALALAVAWQQAGFYWWDGERFWIVPALAGGAEMELPVPL